MSGTLGLWAVLLQIGVIPMEEIRFTDVFEQRYDYSCGIASLSSLVSLYWRYEVTEDMLMGVVPGTGQGNKLKTVSMHDLLVVLERLGFTAGGFTLTYEQLLQAAEEYGPLIVHLAEGEGHFALFLGEVDGYVVIADPSRGCYAGSGDEFLKTWTKAALAAYHPQRAVDSARVHRTINSAGNRIEWLHSWLFQ